MSDIIRDAQRAMNKSHFDELIKEFCPELTIFHGPFGGRDYGLTYWGSYTQTGISDLLIQRMEAKIRELSK